MSPLSQVLRCICSQTQGSSHSDQLYDDSEQFSPAKGLINDAKEVKKALIGHFHYKEEDVCSMTDEEANCNTALWPSEENILALASAVYFIVVPQAPAYSQIKALRDVVRDACPRDAGHCGQQRATTDPNEIDSLDECPSSSISFLPDSDPVAFKYRYTLRKYFVDPFPPGTCLTFNACHSGTLLDKDQYCVATSVPSAKCASPEKEAKHYDGPLPRRHSNDD
ncbi:hypothetical protein EDB86DRAFT_3073879 [Lactarius hatsudake]|nr:hypothetical protein EDB86DRAFT_3073879 [Lactarius hatsudake]